MKTSSQGKRIPHAGAVTSQTQCAQLFELGMVVATPGVLDLLDRKGVNATTYLMRHQRGDFGKVDPHDRQENLFAVDHGLRILSAYDIGEDVLWVITEADRTSTTLLLPSEY